MTCRSPRLWASRTARPSTLLRRLFPFARGKRPPPRRPAFGRHSPRSHARPARLRGRGAWEGRRWAGRMRGVAGRSTPSFSGVLFLRCDYCVWCCAPASLLLLPLLWRWRQGGTRLSVAALAKPVAPSPSAPSALWHAHADGERARGSVTKGSTTATSVGSCKNVVAERGVWAKGAKRDGT